MPDTSPDVLLPQAVDEFLQWNELDRHRSPNTVEAYRRDLGHFLEFAGSHDCRRVADLDRDLIRAYQRHLGKARVRTSGGGTAKGRPLADTTRHRRLVSLRRFLWFTAREEWRPDDLGVTVDLPQLPRRLPKPLDVDEREQLVAGLDGTTAGGLRDKALVLLLLSSGCRISELLSLDRSHWGRERVVVRGKGDREREVLVTERARSAMDTYLEARNDHSPALFISLQPATKNLKSNRLTDEGARFVCHRLSRLVGVRLFHPHQLRHTAGTMVNEATGDARLTADFLGHAGLGSVAGYTAITRSRRELVREALEAGGV
ncbi:MAG: tyrosine-type recombinase/integrase [Candidatus Dormibacteria bacterium]